VTSTSANLSGQPPTADPGDVLLAIGDRIDGLLDGGASPGGPPSTIVDARGPEPRLVREGAVPWSRVVQFLAR
jgi:tRNA A37 threonylcarbamoyladenosine synthetase subunit TsaC/SUA5/YrdC